VSGVNRSAPRILVSRAEPVVGERWEDYADCVVRAGGEPEAITLEAFRAGGSPPAYAGLILTAGIDVDPDRYGQPRSPRVREVNAERDRFEEALFREALRRDLPVLAVCRGHQLLNTLYGGSLLQHLEQREPHRARRSADGESIDSGWHEVRIVPGTRLHRIVGRDGLRVNSRHHQAVRQMTSQPDLAPGCLRLFDAFVEACAGAGAGAG
jgi:putative glutamine amidotransferase